MQAPIRILDSLRPSTQPGLVLAAALSTVVLMATPLVLPSVTEEFAVSAGVAGLFSGVQLGAFVIGSWASGRVASPSRGIFIAAVMVMAGGNIATAIVDGFVPLLASRGAEGLALGVLTWLAWSQVFGDSDRVGDLSTVGPLAGVAAAPMLGILLDAAGFRWVFVTLAVVSLVPLVRIPSFEVDHSSSTSPRHRPVPEAFTLIAALGFVTLGSSAVFVYCGVIASEAIGMSPMMLSILLAANAAAGIPSARWRGRRPAACLWIVGIAACAVGMGVADNGVVFAAVMVAWGFVFWMAVPAVFALLSERSRHPAERAGDAQAVMAMGRVVGPLVGGIAVQSGSFTTLGVVAGVALAIAAVLVFGVERRIPARSFAST